MVNRKRLSEKIANYINKQLGEMDTETLSMHYYETAMLDEKNCSWVEYALKQLLMDAIYNQKQLNKEAYRTAFNKGVNDESE